jgi:hypothetical protein
MFAWLLLQILLDDLGGGDALKALGEKQARRNLTEPYTSKSFLC